MEYEDLDIKFPLKTILESTNLVDALGKEEVATIGRIAQEGYVADKASRAEWETRQANANKLALQVKEAKTYPWPNASSIKFPLITVAAMQYAAKAYPALISGTDLVKCRVIGLDPDGSKSERAERLATHMSWQNLEQDTEWESEHDKLLLVQAIAGCAFIKRGYEPGPARQCTRLVLPDNLVINYFATGLDDASRYTHTYYLSHNAVRERELDGRFADIEDIEPTIQSESSAPVVIAKNERQGIQPPPADRATPFFTGEQFCWWDFDGDGYQEPYVVTFDIGSGKVRRIVARFLPRGVKRRGKTETSDIYCIQPVRAMQKYGFIPSPDGGFYDLGLGSLLGPINESVNTALNQIFDAGTMKNLGGGFFGRGFKGKGGTITFQPGQWYPADAPGDDLRKNILPLPVPEPSAVMFQVIGLLLQYGERIVSATELQVGENIGQNTPAETARTMNDNGARVYNAIYKRTWNCLKAEFNLQYDLNRLFLEVDQDYTELTSGQGAMIRVSDYHDPSITVRPAADPHIVSDTQRIDQAKLVVSLAQSTPGFNRYQTTLRFLKTLNIPEIEQIYPPPMTQGPDGKPQPATDFPPQPDPKMMQVQVKQGELQLKVQEFQSSQMQMKITLQIQLEETMAKIQNLRAQSELYIAQSKSEEVEPQIKLIYAQIESEGAHKDRLLKLLDTMAKIAVPLKEGESANPAASSLPQAAAALASPAPTTVQ